MNSDHVISERAMPKSSRAAPIRRDNTSDRGFAGAWHVDRQMLAFRCERLRELAHFHAGLDDDGHIARSVIDNAIEAGEIERLARSGWCNSVIQRGPTT